MNRNMKLLWTVLIGLANIIIVSLIVMELSELGNPVVAIFGIFLITSFGSVLVYQIIRYIWKIPSK